VTPQKVKLPRTSKYRADWRRLQSKALVQARRWLTALRDDSPQIAIEYINSKLVKDGFAPIDKIEDLARYRSFDQRPAPKFVNSDKILQLFVNKILKKLELPAADKDDLNGPIDLPGALDRIVTSLLAEVP
jgi:hypothetical protein